MTWPLASLGDLVTLKTGPFGSSLHQSEYVAGGIPLINPTHIQNGRLVPDPTVTVSEKKFATLRDFALEAGDVVMGRRGEMGRCAVVTEVERGWLCGTGSIIVRPKNEIDSTFLQRFLSLPSTARRLEGNSVGITMVNLNQKILLGLKIPIPPRAEQRRIVAILDKADALRTKRREAIAKLDQLLQSVFLDMFGDPVLNPKGWPKESLASLFGIARGGSPRPIDAYITDSADGINWIMIGDTVEGSKYIDATRKKIRKEGVSRSRQVGPGDFLLTNSMSFGRPYILRISGCIHDGWLVLSPRASRTSQDYLHSALSSPSIYAEFAKRAPGATVKNLNIDLVSGVEIPVPPQDLQRDFAAAARVIEVQARRMLQQANQLDRLFNSLQRSAFSGTL